MLEKLRTLLCLLFLIFGSAAMLFAQRDSLLQKYNNLKISQLEVEDGLTQGSVFCIFKDSRGFMWFTSLEGLNRFDGHRIKTYQNSDQDSFSLVGNNTGGLVETPDGDVWIGSEFCLNRYIRKTGDFRQIWATDNAGKRIKSTNYPFFSDDRFLWYFNNVEGVLKLDFSTGEKTVVNSEVKYKRSLFIINSTRRASDGSIWIREEEGLVRINSRTGKAKYYFSNHPENEFGVPTVFNDVFERKSGRLWLATYEKMLFDFNPKTNEIAVLDLSKELGSTISSIVEADDGTLYLGTESNGLFIFHPEYGILNHLHSDRNDNLKLANNSASTLYLDYENILWINSDPAAVHGLTASVRPFKKYFENLFEDEKIPTITVRSFMEMPDGKIWIGTTQNGIALFNPKTDKFEKRFNYDDDSGFESDHATWFLNDSKNRLWVATNDGLFLFNKEKKTFSQIEITANPNKFHLSNAVWKIIEMPDENFVLSTDAGVYFRDDQTEEIHTLESLKSIVGGGIFADKNERIFIPEENNGFHLVNYSDWVKNPNLKTGIRHFLSEYHIKHFYQPPGANFLWIGTGTGLLKITPNSDWSAIEKTEIFTTADGLPSNYIYAVLPDEIGDLWLTTNRGLSRFDPIEKTFKNFDVSDNIQGYEFNTNAFLKTRSGEMYVGGTSGFNRFFPNQTSDLNYIPKNIQLIDFQVNGKPFSEIGNIGEVSNIDLKSNENTFTIAFSAMDFFSGGGNFYKVKLEGFDDDWLDIGNRTSVRYTKVPPGDYTFSVLAANKDKVWSKTPKFLNLRIAKAWYQTTWFFLLSTAVLWGLIYWIYQNRLARKIAAERTRQLQQSEEFKNRFFANITHEFRTPLTVILGLAEEVKRHPERDFSKRLNLIEKNGFELLDLVNQMLELTRLEAGKHELNFEQGDLNSFLKIIVASYASFAESRQLNLNFHSEESEIIMDFDSEKIKRILTNLISNALKFSPSGGKISVSAKVLPFQKGEIFRTQKVSPLWRGETLEIAISDNGKGIALKDLPHIFKRFYYEKSNGKNGFENTGIGLALVKELVEILGGEISAKSEPGIKTTFTVLLPMTQNAPFSQKENQVAKQFTGSEIDSNLSIESIADAPTLLIVEDNPELIYFLESCLAEQYQILKAENGKIGIKKAIETIPDIIISDVMMPEADGFELCKTLKTNEATSHIPIILLTARTAEKDKLEGLSHGADAYLAKPFNREELLIRLEKLVASRKAMQRKYADLVGLKIENPTEPESAFLKKANEILEENYNDQNFGVADFCAQIFYSRVQVHRKLKALTDKNTSTFIRSFRLKKAVHFLKTTELPIAEVASRCGFSGIARFNQSFKEEFNQTPSKIRK